MSVALNCEVNDDSVFVRQAIKECCDSTGLEETSLFPCTDRCRASILQRAQELKREYHTQTEVIR